MSEKLQIYSGKNNVFKKEQGRLDKANISSQNKELIALFQDYYFSLGTGELRISKLTAQLRLACGWLEHELGISNSLANLNKGELMRLVSYINRLEGKADATRADYRRVLKQFYFWYKEEDQRKYSEDHKERVESHKFYHYIEKEVNATYKQRQADPNTIITEEDVMRVLDYGCKTIKEKAFISTLHELGCRASEYLNLKVGSISFKNSHAVIDIPDGKTGKRVVYATKSVALLVKYIDVHPDRHNNNAYLWVSDAQFNHDDPLLHKGGQSLINRCFERASVKKKHNFHWFRHSRATLLAPKLTEAMLCKYMGWSLGSRQVKTYIHLCNKQLEDVFLKMNGLEPEIDESEKPIKCTCGTLNHPGEKYCQKCYRPLDVSLVIHREELKDERFVHDTAKLLSMMSSTDPLMMKTLVQLAKNPEVMIMLENIKGK